MGAPKLVCPRGHMTIIDSAAFNVLTSGKTVTLEIICRVCGDTIALEVSSTDRSQRKVLPLRQIRE